MSKHACSIGVLALAVLLTATAGPSFAQWQWTDANGRRIFSDTAPPADVPDKNVLRRPGGDRRVPPIAETPTGAATNAEIDNANKVASDKKAAALLAQKKRAEEAEKAKEKADAQRAGAIKADNCKRAQQNLASLSTGRMLSTVNDKGERVFMSEDARNAETSRLRQIAQQSCSP